MTEFLTAAELADYLERDVTGAITSVVTRTNALVTEQWTHPVDPVPEWVKNIAWNVAIRAGANPTGVTSTTRAWDDITRTDRFESGQKQGVYLTDDEETKLHGDIDSAGGPVAAGSIPMVVPGWSRPRDYPCY
jgi:hypothetical protein